MGELRICPVCRFMGEVGFTNGCSVTQQLSRVGPGQETTLVITSYQTVLSVNIIDSVSDSSS